MLQFPGSIYNMLFNFDLTPEKSVLSLKCNFITTRGNEWSRKLANWKESFLSISKRFSQSFYVFWISGQSSATIYHRLREHQLWQRQRFPEGLFSSSQGRYQHRGCLPEQVRARPHVWWSPQEGEDSSLIFLCKFFILSIKVLIEIQGLVDQTLYLKIQSDQCRVHRCCQIYE